MAKKAVLAQHANRVAEDFQNYATAYDAFLWAKENDVLPKESNPEELAQAYALRFAPETTKQAFQAMLNIVGGKLW